MMKHEHHEEISEMAAEREVDDAQAEEMYQEMEKAKPYIGGGIFGHTPILGLSTSHRFNGVCSDCGVAMKVRYKFSKVGLCDDCYLPF